MRSGAKGVACDDPRLASPNGLAIGSLAFTNSGTLPQRYRGIRGISPPLRWHDVPGETRSLVLIVEDVDVPLPAPLVHAIVYALDPLARELEAGAIPTIRFRRASTIRGASLGLAAGIAPGWLPVTPLAGHGPHRYVFQLFALDCDLGPFRRPPSRRRLIAAMVGHVIASGSTIGVAEA